MRGFYERLPVVLRPKGLLACQAAELIARREFARADDLVRRALWRYRDDSALLEQHAFSAHNSGRYDLARARWERLRAQEPMCAMAWTGVACNLRELERSEEAVQVALDAFALFPDNGILIGELGRLFRTAPSRTLKEKLLLALRSTRLDDPEGEQMLIDAEMSLGNVPEATALVDASLSRRQGSPALLARAAELAFSRRDWTRLIVLVEELQSRGASSDRFELLLDVALHQLASDAEQNRYRLPSESLRDFDQVLRHRPDNANWVALRIDTLVKLGQLEDAEHDLRIAMQRFGTADRSIGLVRAMLSAKRELWEATKSMLADHLARFPEDWQAAELLDHVESEWVFEQSQKPDHAPSAAIPRDVGVEDNAAVRALLLGFESLGDNCEFGLVQRHFKAEPIGLFRWNNTRVVKLTEALEARLAGIGSEEFTEMTTVDVEYFLTDKRWGFGFHTFCTKNEVTFDVLYPKMCKRLGFLRNKFLEDLRSGEKTFLLKSDDVTYEELQRLHRALSLDRPVKLICVKQLARAPLPGQTFGGDVFKLGEGLYVGYVKRFGLAYPQRELQFDDWVAICRDFADAAAAPFAPDRL